MLARRQAERPTAFVCSSIGLALGVKRAAGAAGLVIGRDMALIAHDDRLHDIGAENFDPAAHRDAVLDRRGRAARGRASASPCCAIQPIPCRRKSGRSISWCASRRWRRRRKASSARSVLAAGRAACRPCSSILHISQSVAPFRDACRVEERRGNRLPASLKLKMQTSGPTGLLRREGEDAVDAEIEDRRGVGGVNVRCGAAALRMCRRPA